MRDERFFDELIDASLRHYASAEPLAGIDQRILHRLEAVAVREPRDLGWTLWATGALTIVLLVFFLNHRRTPGTSKPIASLTAEVPKTTVIALAPPASQKRTKQLMRA